MIKTFAPAVLAATLTISAFGGGMYLNFNTADASPEAKAKGAAFIVRMEGCHDAAKATYTGVAEGLVNGERKTIPLEILPLTSPGMFAIKFARPDTGVWILHVKSENEGAKVAVLLPLPEHGLDRKNIKYAYNKPFSTGDVTAALSALAAT